LSRRIDSLRNPPQAQTEEARGISQFDDIDLSQ
jgi:hypothetical protein